MKALSHAAILEAGRYSGVRIGADEAENAKLLYRFMLRLRGAGMPATAFDAKGLLLESIFGENPVLMIEHRSLFTLKHRVREVPYRIRFGRAAVRRHGEDLTIVALGALVPFALCVAVQLATHGVRAEVIDLRTVSPLDTDAVCTSVEKTGRLCGVSAEVIARVAERSGRKLKSEPVRICHPDGHTPMSSALETVPEETLAVERLRTLAAGT